MFRDHRCFGLAVVALGLWIALPAQAQTGCVPNPNLSGPPFTDGCPLPAAALNNALIGPKAVLTGTLTGTLTNSSIDGQVAPFAQIAVTGDTSHVTNPCSPTCTGIPSLALDHFFGGTGAGAGGRQGLWVNLTQTGNMTNPNGVPFHTGIFSNVLMSAGTSDGANVYTYAAQMADNIGGHYVITGGEIDIASNASNFRKEGWAVASAPLAGGKDTFPGSNYDAGYGLWASGGCGAGTLAGGSACGGFQMGFSFGRDDGYFPIGKHGILIGVHKGLTSGANLLADWGINFVDVNGISPITFTFCAFRSQGACINNDGNYKMDKPFPAIVWLDTSITNPNTNGGLMRLTSNGGSPNSFVAQINTAAAGDFSTVIQPFGFTSAQFILNAGLVLATNTIANLGTTCTSAQKGLMYYVTDAAASPVYNATVVGSGTVNIPVFCNGTNWTNH